MAAGLEIVLPPERRHIEIMAPSLWALILCVLIRICMMIYYPIATIIGSDAVFATASAVVGLQNGEDWIWDTGASMDLIGKQDATQLTETDKIALNPPINIDTASGKTSVEFKVECQCLPLNQTVTP